VGGGKSGVAGAKAVRSGGAGDRRAEPKHLLVASSDSDDDDFSSLSTSLSKSTSLHRPRDSAEAKKRITGRACALCPDPSANTSHACTVDEGVTGAMLDPPFIDTQQNESSSSVLAQRRMHPGSHPSWVWAHEHCAQYVEELKREETRMGKKRRDETKREEMG
jgi:hypothetical protein